MSEAGCVNTDREIWRGPDLGNGAFYADSIFVTEGGGIGINCGGTVIVRPLREWHASLAREGEMRREREEITQLIRDWYTGKLPCLPGELIVSIRLKLSGLASPAPSSGEIKPLTENVKDCFREHGELSEENARFRRALQRIADLIDSEAGEPLDDAIRIANKALASSSVDLTGEQNGNPRK